MSNRILSAMLILFCLLPGYADTATHYDGRIGYSRDGMEGSRYKDVRIAFKTMTQEMANEENLTIAIDYFESPEAALEGFLRHDFDLLGMSSHTYGRYHRNIREQTGHYWVVQRSDTPLEKMLLLVRRDSGIDSLAALRGKHVTAGSENRVARVFLDRLLLENLGQGVGSMTGTFAIVDRDSTGVLQTYFNKSDACIVPEHVYALVAEMNPALPAEMRILAESSRIFPHVLMLGHRAMHASLIRVYEKYAYNLENTKRGRQILELYKFRKVLAIDPKILLPLEHYFDAYEALKVRYGAGHE